MQIDGSALAQAVTGPRSTSDPGRYEIRTRLLADVALPMCRFCDHPYDLFFCCYLMLKVIAVVHEVNVCRTRAPGLAADHRMRQSERPANSR